MDRFEQTQIPGTNSTDRRSFNISCPVGALVGTSGASSHDIIENYDAGNPANTDGSTIPVGSLSSIIGYRTIGGYFATLGSGQQIQVTISGISQFYKNVSETVVCTSGLPAFVTQYAYCGKVSVQLLAITEIDSDVDFSMCSVGFGSSVPYPDADGPDATKGQQILFFDDSAGTYAVDAATYDPQFHTFVPDSTPAIGDSYITVGCSDCFKEPPSGSVETTPVASF